MTPVDVSTLQVTRIDPAAERRRHTESVLEPWDVYLLAADPVGA